jgi:uncharacterized coiled-coil DUF342 family protein
MNEIDFKTLLGSYQQKSFDLFNQVIALEAKIITANQTIESLKEKVNQLSSEIEKKSKRSTKNNEDFSSPNIE